MAALRAVLERDSVEAHQSFRDSERFPRWRSFVGPHLAGPPHVEHCTDVRDVGCLTSHARHVQVTCRTPAARTVEALPTKEASR